VPLDTETRYINRTGAVHYVLHGGSVPAKEVKQII